MAVDHAANVHELQRLRDAGIVDQHVDPTEFAHHLLDRGDAGIPVGHIAGDTAMGLAQFAGGRRRLSGIEIEDDRASAVLGEQRGDGSADAAPVITQTLLANSIFPPFLSWIALRAISWIARRAI
jgi:hypothetical protein